MNSYCSIFLNYLLWCTFRNRLLTDVGSLRRKIVVVDNLKSEAFSRMVFRWTA